MKTGAPETATTVVEHRVLGIQAKLHRWAVNDHRHRFKDLYNLVCDPAVLAVAWNRVKGNRGSRTAGTDGVTARYIVIRGEADFLADLRAELKARRFRPRPVRERTIPKAGGRRRRLGIATVRDRVVQAALKLVLEPIFEANFQPCSYGFRPGRRTQDAIAEIHLLTSRTYEWVLEGDITACFDEIAHPALMARIRDRIGDPHVLRLIKAFLQAGILGEDGIERATDTGTPQGGILSPLLSNVALADLDNHFSALWETTSRTEGARRRRWRQGLATYRLVRYADDFVVLVHGTRAQAEAMRTEVAAVLAPIGLRLSEAKTQVVHIDDGFDFLGYRIQRHQKRGGSNRYVYTYPSKTALLAVTGKVRQLTREVRNRPLAVLLYRLNPVLRGWTNYFRHGASKATFSYLSHFSWQRVVRWLRHKYAGRSWPWLRRHYLPGWQPTDGSITLYVPNAVPVTRYRYRGSCIPLPWTGVPCPPR